MTTVSQSSALLRSFWPKLKGFSPLSLVREKASARLAEQSVTRARIAALVYAEIIPRLAAVDHVATPYTKRVADLIAAKQSKLSPGELEEAVKLALAPDETALMLKVDQLRDSGMSSSTIEHDFIAPIARYLGDGWTDDRYNFTDVTLACGRLQAVLRYLNETEPAAEAVAANSTNILLLASDNQQHTLGLLMVAEAFRREGWQVECPFLGGERGDNNAQTQASLNLVSAQWFDVVGISVCTGMQESALKQLVASLKAKSKNPQLKVLVGGAVLNDVKDAHLQFGADGHATEARLTPVLAKKLLASQLNCKQ
jgi:MerR family transcriptional regulator, light-induced transcriptional regulator